MLRMEHHQAYKLPERRAALVAKKRPTQCANPLKIFTLADLSVEFFDHDQPCAFAIWRRVWRLIVPGEIETGVAGYSTLGVEWHKTGDRFELPLVDDTVTPLCQRAQELATVKNPLCDEVDTAVL